MSRKWVSKQCTLAYSLGLLSSPFLSRSASFISRLFFQWKFKYKGNFQCFCLCTHGKKLASSTCRSVCQMVAGRGSGCVWPGDRAEKGTVKNTSAPGGTRHVLKTGLSNTVISIIFHHHVSSTWWLRFPDKAPVERPNGLQKLHIILNSISVVFVAEAFSIDFSPISVGLCPYLGSNQEAEWSTVTAGSPAWCATRGGVAVPLACSERSPSGHSVPSHLLVTKNTSSPLKLLFLFKIQE